MPGARASPPPTSSRFGAFFSFFLCKFSLVDLYHLIYQSQALGAFGAPELAALLHRGRTHNQAHGISGVLLHTVDGRFLQVLEGPQTAVRHLYYHVILSDTRHFHCQVPSAALPAGRWAAAWPTPPSCARCWARRQPTA
jgi:hypothetical protein